ncbi:hypothetical protein U14_01266 [Candidatus Moduliflexus flocculans]|uniref:Uncharacterized protein n=1 Tax=Candidatus Moduliflexus flocculans TaxID=1499966 RepID=A0A0S6VWC3_9BACT|nr:hypothetical protein U14_01266 [Candidatus Moduliflexus flocculans]
MDIHFQRACANDTAFTPTTSHKCRMAGHAAASRQNCLSGSHPFDIFRVGFFAHKDDFLAFFRPCDSISRCKDDLAGCAAGAGWQAFTKHGCGFFGFRIKNRVQQFVQLFRFHAGDSGLLVNQAFMQHVERHLQRCRAIPFPNAALQHVEFAFLNGKLDVEHVFVMIFEFALNAVQFVVHSWHPGFEGDEIFGMVGFADFVDRVRGADASDDIFALRIDEPFAVEIIFAGGRVTGEGDACCGRFAHVAEDHGLHIDGSAPVIRNSFNLAIRDSAAAIPTLEHGADAAP